MTLTEKAEAMAEEYAATLPGARALERRGGEVMAKRGPKPYKFYDPEKLKIAIKKGVPHGTRLYGYGCRCETCAKAKRDAAKKYRDSVSLKPQKQKKQKIEPEFSGDLPIGAWNFKISG